MVYVYLFISWHYFFVNSSLVQEFSRSLDEMYFFSFQAKFLYFFFKMSPIWLTCIVFSISAALYALYWFVFRNPTNIFCQAVKKGDSQLQQISEIIKVGNVKAALYILTVQILIFMFFRRDWT